MEEIIALIISGHYSNVFFDVFMTNVTVGVKNNLALLLAFAFMWKKISRFTKNTWDDRASNWLVRKLTGYKKESIIDLTDRVQTPVDMKNKTKAL